MTKTLGVVLVAALAVPSSVLAQATTGRPAVVTVQGTSELRQSIDREAARLAKRDRDAFRRSEAEHSWAGRHPVALGAMTGAAGGVIWGLTQCSSSCEVYPLPSIAGGLVGAGIGAGIGAIVSVVRR